MIERWSASTRRVGSMPFRQYVIAPSCRSSRTTESDSSPERTRIAVSGETSRMPRTALGPPPPGMSTSTIAASGACSCARVIAPSLSPATATTSNCRSSVMPRAERTTGSSSAIRSLGRAAGFSWAFGDANIEGVSVLRPAGSGFLKLSSSPRNPGFRPPTWLIGGEVANRDSQPDTLNAAGQGQMSFRARLITFFLVIVVVPMIAMGALVFRLISDSTNGKADARADGLAAAAAGVYSNAAASARADALALGHDPALLHSDPASLAKLIATGGLVRIAVTQNGSTTAAGDPTALAPGAAQVRYSTGEVLTLTVSALSASQFVRELSAPQSGVVVREGGRVLAQNVAASAISSFPTRGTVSIDGERYREVTQRFSGWGAPVTVSVLSSVTASTGSVGSSRLLAILFIAGFLLLALGFALLSSRALQAQLVRFLQAARRLGSGDFSEPVPVAGSDEFAALAEEFNSMSSQLEHRMQELSEER